MNQAQFEDGFSKNNDESKRQEKHFQNFHHFLYHKQAQNQMEENI